MQQQLNQAKMGIGDQASQAKAFGGSRQGIQEGVADAQGALNMGQMAAQLNSQNFQQAQAAATGDISRDLTAQQANQGANQANINSLIQAGTGLAGLGSQAQQNQRQQFLELSTAGAQQQQQAQNQIDAQKQQFAQANAYPGQQLGILQSALGMTPYGSTTMGSSTGQQQTTQNNGIAGDIFGGLQALGGAFGAGGPFAAGGALAGLMGSDRHLKTDIQKVGVHAPTGLPMYSYRYKGDPKSYAKVTGPMAEDVAKVAPHAVKTLGVHKPTGQAAAWRGHERARRGRTVDQAAAHAGRRRLVYDTSAWTAHARDADGDDRRDGLEHACAAHAPPGRHATRCGGLAWLTSPTSIPAFLPLLNAYTSALGKAGIGYRVESGYRTPEQQAEIYERSGHGTKLRRRPGMALVPQLRPRGGCHPEQPSRLCEDARSGPAGRSLRCAGRSWVHQL